MDLRLESIDRVLLEELQTHLPITHRPYAAVATRLGMSEQDCLTRIERLRRDGVIERLGARFDPRALGYRAALIAMRIDPRLLERGAQVVGSHPGVSRIDERHDPYNLWCSLALPPSIGASGGHPFESLERTADLLHRLAGAEETMVLPVLRGYIIARGDGLGAEASLELDTQMASELSQAADRPVLTKRDMELVRVVQDDLPLIEMPFAVWAEQASVTEEELAGWIRRMQEAGAITRFAASTRERAPGAARELLAWRVPAEQIDGAGEMMSQFRRVVHCVQRPTYPNWPYSVFVTIAAPTSGECLAVARRIEEHACPFPYKRLETMKVYKADRLRYFPRDLESWWQQASKTAI